MSELSPAALAAIRHAVREELENVLPRLVASLRPDHEVPRRRLGTTRDAAKIARVTAETIRDWIAAGRLTRYGVGREIRVDLDELENVLTGKSCTVSAAVNSELERLGLR